jgi:hypothetical protein
MKALLSALLPRPQWLWLTLLLWLPAHADEVLFYQPLNADSSIDAATWQDIWQGAAEAGVHTVIVQWTDRNDAEFGGPDGWLLSALTQAEQQGIGLVLGLYYDTRYYTLMNNPRQVTYFWHLWQAAALRQRDWLLEHSSLQPRGWYLPMELDDLLLRDPALRSELNRQLASFTALLDEPVHISAFSAGVLTPDLYADWLASLPVAQVWWQDGRGTAALPVDILEQYEQNLPCNIGIVREAFRQRSSTGEGFAAEPGAPRQLPSASCHPSAVFSLRYRPWGSPLLQTP